MGKTIISYKRNITINGDKLFYIKIIPKTFGQGPGVIFWVTPGYWETISEAGGGWPLHSESVKTGASRSFTYVAGLLGLWKSGAVHLVQRMLSNDSPWSPFLTLLNGEKRVLEWAPGAGGKPCMRWAQGGGEAERAREKHVPGAEESKLDEETHLTPLTSAWNIYQTQ